jgi:hypothetical protein
MRKAIDLSGKKFGRLLVIERAGTNTHGAVTWKVRCKCGNKKIVSGKNLSRGATRSCGCLRYEIRRDATIKRNFSHGLTNSRAHKFWLYMRFHCNSPKASNYSKFAAKGIKVCKRWDSFLNFYKDMGDPPSVLHGLARINKKANFTPKNCKWAIR